MYKLVSINFLHWNKRIYLRKKTLNKSFNDFCKHIFFKAIENKLKVWVSDQLKI